MSNRVRSLLGLAAATLLMAAAQPAAAITVSIDGAPANVTAGDNFSVDVVVGGITNEIVTAWDIDVAFDASLLSNAVFTFHVAPLGGAADSFFDVFFGSGLTDAYANSLLSDADITAIQCPGGVCSPTLKLATLGFTALKDGAVDIGLVNWGQLNSIRCERNTECYPTKTGVPEPGTLALLGLGLAGLGLSRRRKAA